MEGPWGVLPDQPGVTSRFICGLRTSCWGRGGAGPGDMPEPGQEGAGEAQSPAARGSGGSSGEPRGGSGRAPRPHRQGPLPAKAEPHAGCWGKRDCRDSRHALRDAPTALLKLPGPQAGQATATHHLPPAAGRSRLALRSGSSPPAARLLFALTWQSAPDTVPPWCLPLLGPYSTPPLRPRDPLAASYQRCLGSAGGGKERALQGGTALYGAGVRNN